MIAPASPPRLRVPSLLECLCASDATQLFAHGVSSLAHRSALRAVLPGIDEYAERALLLAERRDVVCVLEPVEEAYLDYLTELKLGPAANRVVVASEGSHGRRGGSLPAALLGNPTALDRITTLLRGEERTVLNPFAASASEFALAARLGAILGRRVEVLGSAPPLAYRLSKKHRQRALAVEAGVPVAPGEVVTLPADARGRVLDVVPLRAALGRRLDRSSRVIIRGTYGVSGSATWVVGNGFLGVDEALERVVRRRDNRIYLVEEMFEVLVSPNLQMFIEPPGGRITCVGISDQRWVGTLVHGGNASPSRAETLPEMVACAERISTLLQRAGYSGLAGFDFGEHLEAASGRRRPFFAEVNLRINGATYPIALVERLNREQARLRLPPIRAFATANLRPYARSFQDFERSYGEAFFQRERGAGVLPFNTGCLRHGQLTVAVLGGTREEVLADLGRFRAQVENEKRAAAIVDEQRRPTGP